MFEQAPTVIALDGVGSSTCSVDGASLAYAWVARYSDGTHADFCSTHVPALGTQKATADEPHPDVVIPFVDDPEATVKETAALLIRFCAKTGRENHYAYDAIDIAERARSERGEWTPGWSSLYDQIREQDGVLWAAADAETG